MGYTGLVDDAYEAAIVGGGAAGLSAALTLGRSCRRVVVCDDGRPRNVVAERMHGFLTRDGTPPREMLRIARAELERYPSVTLRDVHIETAQRTGSGFVLSAGAEEIAAATILLATGRYDALPEIAGLQERWGKSVFVCPYCDGWELRDKRVAVLGKGGRAVELAQELRQWTNDLLVCTEGAREVSAEHQRWLERAGAVEKRSQLAQIDDECVLRFSDGSEERCDALFLCAPLRQRYPLVEMLGCRVSGEGEIAADARGRTGVQGVYAAGDAVTAVHQVVLAAASGVCAAMAINEDLLAAEVRRLSA